MKSFQEIYTELQDQTGDDSSAQLTIFKRHINDTQRLILGQHSWKFLEFTANITTEADDGRYEIPASVRKLLKVEVLDASGDVDQVPEIVEDAGFWARLQRRKAGSSDITQFVYQEGNDLLTWPDFSTAGRTIRVRGRKNVVDMTRDDYTTGTITSIANAATTVEASGSSWNGRKPVLEQYIRIDATSGDLRWYRIASITDDDTLELEKNYLGTSISADTETYTIGEMPVIPDTWDTMLVTRPLAIYYQKLENLQMANHYWNQYDGGYEIGRSRKPGGMLAQFIKDQAGAVDSKYFPPQGRGGDHLSPEFLAKDTTSTLG